MTGKFNCDGCGACCKLVPDHALKAFGLPVSENGGCGHLKPDMSCAIYESRPDVCNVRTMWEKVHRARVSWEDYCALNEKICGTFKAMVGER